MDGAEAYEGAEPAGFDAEAWAERHVVAEPELEPEGEFEGLFPEAPEPEDEDEFYSGDPDVSDELLALRAQLSEEDGWDEEEPDPWAEDAEAEEGFWEEDADPEEVAQVLDGLIQEAAQERIAGELAALTEGFERDQLGELARAHPDLMDPRMQARLRETLHPLEDQLGVPGLATHPQFVEMAYLAEKARQAAARELPIEKVPEGARLEIAPGAGAPRSSDPAGDFKRELFEANRGASRFER